MRCLFPRLAPFRWPQAIAPLSWRKRPLEGYVDVIEELDVRRRVNVLYPNPQSLFDGLHVGFVNVAAGNLSFRRRDLVARASGPVVFARVHDSRIEANGDFGRGWRLSLAEELIRMGKYLVYIDRSGARHRFKDVADGSGGYTADPPTPRHAGTRITFSDGTAVLREAADAIRTFEPADAEGARYRIARVESGSRRADFVYANGVLDAVVHDGRTLFDIDRDDDGAGKISAVTDDRGRTVRYSYARGLLKDVIDLAGNLWWHEYDDAGRLTAAIGANRQPYLRVRYDERGRVVDSRTGREYAYSYRRNGTTVTEGSGQRHEFGHDDGATVRLTSSNGTAWRLHLDADHRVRKLEKPDGAVAFTYTPNGRVASIVETMAGVAVRREYAYDAQGRLVSVDRASDARIDVDYASSHVRLSGSNGYDFAYKLSRDGQVEYLQDGDARFDVDRNLEGDLTALRSNGRSVRLSRDRSGRIVATEYPDGSVNRYLYDALGNRRLVEYGARGAVRYRHDAAGNIFEVEVTELDGTTKRQSVTVGDMNRVERVAYEGAHTLRVDYDAMGRPVRFDTGTAKVTAEYTHAGRLRRLNADAANEVVHFGDHGLPVGSATEADRLRSVLSRDGGVDAHPDYGAVAFAETTFEPVPRDPVEVGVPGLAAARALAALAKPLFAGDAQPGMADFEKPSNPVFQPAEYRATNCCMPFNGEYCTPLGYGSGGGGIVFPHRMRIQAQIGKELLAASNQHSKVPIPMTDCLLVLNSVRSGVKPKDGRRLKKFFAQVERRIRTCGVSGCTPAHTRSFPPNAGRNGYHADFEVHAGVVCVP